MELISKKLLEELMGSVQEFIPEEHRVRYCKFGDFDEWHEIDIYKIVFLCKEWAWDVYRASLVTYLSSDGWWSEIGEMRFNADTESDVVFKACECLLREEVPCE